MEVRGWVRDRGGDGGDRDPGPRHRVERGEGARGSRAGDQTGGQPLRRSVAWSMVQTAQPRSTLTLSLACRGQSSVLNYRDF